LAVKHENLHRRLAPVPKDEHATGEGIRLELLATDSSKPVYTPAKIHRLYGDEDPHVRCYLDHASFLQKR
jgi:hypothetical protein